MGDHGSEIDIFETFDRGDRRYHGLSNRHPRIPGTNTTLPDHEGISDDAREGVDAALGQDFQTLGLLWRPGLLVWFIDGVEVRREPRAAVPGVFAALSDDGGDTQWLRIRLSTAMSSFFEYVTGST